MGVAVVLGMVVRPVVADELDWKLRLESGSEYDSNVHRRYDDTQASPLLRGAAQLDLGWRVARSQRLLVTGLAGAKTYATLTARNENVAIATADVRYQWLLPARSALLSARFGYYDTLAYAYDYDDGIDCSASADIPRFFSSGVAEVSMDVRGPGTHRLQLSLGGQRFRYKACSQFHWIGDRYGINYQTTKWRGDPERDVDAASIDIRVAYQLQRRFFSGQALSNRCGTSDALAPRCFVPTELGRADFFHSLAAEVVYTGERIYSARYELDITDSNSHGQSLLRQRVELAVTSELFAKLFLTAKAAVQLDVYLDSLLLARDIAGDDFTSIDDENHNALSVHLARDVSRRWTVEARYAFYSNEFATRPQTFRRQIMYIGAVYRYQP